MAKTNTDKGIDMMSFDISKYASSEIQIKIRLESAKLDYEISKSFNKLFLILTVVLSLYSLLSFFSMISIEENAIEFSINNYLVFYSMIVSIILSIIFFIVFKLHLIKKLSRYIEQVNYYSDVQESVLSTYKDFFEDSLVKNYLESVKKQRRKLCNGELLAIRQYINSQFSNS